MAAAIAVELRARGTAQLPELLDRQLAGASLDAARRVLGLPVA